MRVSAMRKYAELKGPVGRVNRQGASAMDAASISESEEDYQTREDQGVVTASRAGIGGGGQDKDRNEQGLLQKVTARMQDTGILPLTIRLPKSGTRHAFNRLMTAQEALELNVTYVNLPVAILPFASVGVLLLGYISCLAWMKFLR